MPLAPFTTLGLGGPARYLVEATTEEELIEALTWASRTGLAAWVLGGGSNVVVSDRGFPGLVVRVALRGTDIEEAGDWVRLRVAAGEPWDGVVALAVERGWAGLESLSGIPGLTGATPIQNVGAYGQAVGDALVEVEARQWSSGRRRIFAAAECGLGYRTSVFKKGFADQWVVVAVSFRLRPGGRPRVRYAELERELAERGAGSPDLAEVREAVLALRRRKGMVLDPADVDTRSDGSFFLNPTLDELGLTELRQRLGPAAAELPVYPLARGAKVSAAWLIERAGFRRGEPAGPVGLSSKHALAIVHRGGGTAAQVVAFMQQIQAEVEGRFGVRLEPEPRLVGFEPV